MVSLLEATIASQEPDLDAECKPMYRRKSRAMNSALWFREKRNVALF